MSGSPLDKSRILLCLSGGIAVYKGAELCRRFLKAGAQVQVIMTRAATEFVAPLTFETLTGRPVYTEMFQRERAWEIEHIALARWGRILVVAPATANTIAKMAAGLADDALSTTVLAFRGPVVVAPAMNTAMWEHPQTQENLARLRDRGVRIVEPEVGELACGEEGAGRLAEAEQLLIAVRQALLEACARGPLAGRRVLITAGPTVEPIDPVRHLSNSSSGRMGFALAEEARLRGAEVTLVCGPTQIAPPENLAKLICIQRASEMRDAVLDCLAEQDVCVFCAAVTDFAPRQAASEKVKKGNAGDSTTLLLVRTPDVAAEANAAREPRQTFVGFAAETHDVVKHARAKMESKGFDVVVANEVCAENPAFGVADNRVTLLSRTGEALELDSAPKRELAAPIWDFILDHLRESREPGGA